MFILALLVSIVFNALFNLLYMVSQFAILNLMVGVLLLLPFIALTVILIPSVVYL